MEAPHSRQAEWSVVAQMLQSHEKCGEVVGAQLEPDDFFNIDTRMIFEGAVEAFYADERVDAVTVGERKRAPLAAAWSCEEGEVASKLLEFTNSYGFTEGAAKHAEVVRRYGDNRRLMALAQSTLREIQDNQKSPQEIGDMLTTGAAAITAGKAARRDVLDWMTVGGEFVRHLRKLKAAREQGVELAAYFGLPFIDTYMKGLQPQELWMVGGEPGVGKSAVVWVATEGFARRQLRRPPEERVSALILSMEMGLIPSSGRLATKMSNIDSGKLREGNMTDQEIQQVAKDWAHERELPLHFNFASNFKLSQLRALVVEAIRRHNVGLIVVDHFRMIDPDRRINNANQEDEEKARFLKENIAKDLNVAVICLAHTFKMKREGSDGRPTLNDLRGSYQVAAHCDAVSFIYRPYMYATENEISENVVKETDAEMLWRKNRNGELGIEPFGFNPARMAVRNEPY
jgi:replicative DNA helicase